MSDILKKYKATRDYSKSMFLISLERKIPLPIIEYSFSIKNDLPLGVFDRLASSIFLNEEYAFKLFEFDVSLNDTGIANNLALNDSLTTDIVGKLFAMPEVHSERYSKAKEIFLSHPNLPKIYKIMS
jgi:hypothetical protein